VTSALDGGEWSASRPGCFTPSERAPCCVNDFEDLMLVGVGKRAGKDRLGD